MSTLTSSGDGFTTNKAISVDSDSDDQRANDSEDPPPKDSTPISKSYNKPAPLTEAAKNYKVLFRKLPELREAHQYLWPRKLARELHAEESTSDVHRLASCLLLAHNRDDYLTFATEAVELAEKAQSEYHNVWTLKILKYAQDLLRAAEKDSKREAIEAQGLRTKKFVAKKTAQRRVKVDDDDGKKDGKDTTTSGGKTDIRKKTLRTGQKGGAMKSVPSAESGAVKADDDSVGNTSTQA